MSDLEISEQAIDYVKKNRKMIIDKFASTLIYGPYSNPATFFMAGSPGAGKTETSQDFIVRVENEMNQKLGVANEYRIVRIDGDEIRTMLPGYTGNNSSLFQGAISIGVSELIRHCFKKKLNMLIDGTFASRNSLKNIERAINHQRKPIIIYVYQDPLRAWELTMAREIKEGRAIPLEAFVNSYFSAKENINEVKRIWGEVARLDYIERDFDKNWIRYEINVENIDECLNIGYTKSSLTEMIQANYK